MTRVAFLHTGAVVIPTFAGLAATHLPGVEVHNLLDDRIVADLGRGADPQQISERLHGLGRAATEAGASAVVLTCSSISEYAQGLADQIGIPVLRIDEAMADEAVARGSRIAVVATLPTTLGPTARLLRERADLAGRDVELTEVVVDGAFDAVASGDRARHDDLVGRAVADVAGSHDLIVLAQASMAGALEGLHVDVPVLTSPELGIRRVADRLSGTDVPSSDPT